MEVNDAGKRSKIIKRLVIIAIVILLLLIILSLICYFKNQKGGEKRSDNLYDLSLYKKGEEKSLDNLYDISLDKNATVGKVAQRSQDEVIAELNKQVEEGMINISMNTNPVFETGTSEGNLIIVNEETNRYPQVVEIYLEDTNELIYKSGGIPVGSKIENATLDYNLSKGTYDCIAYFNAINPDTGELVGKAGANIKVTINN